MKRAVQVAADSPRTDLRLGRLEIIESELGFVARARDPAYRLYLSEGSITATNVSNGFRAGPADLKIAPAAVREGRRRRLETAGE